MKLGVILRCFAKTPEQVAVQVGQIHDLVEKLASMYETIHRIDVVIPTNPKYIDVDCGETKKAMGRLPSHTVLSTVRETSLDLFSGAINETAALQLDQERCTHTLVLSSSCASLVSTENMEAMLTPFETGAKATGLVLPDPTLGEFIKRGCITNTFAIWDLVSFFTVGGMDLSLRNRYKDERLNEYVRGNGELIPITGLEIPTIARLIECYGPCIVPVIPITGGKWKRPDKETDPAGYAREEAKMRSKKERHLAIAARHGFSLSYIESGILPGYPK